MSIRDWVKREVELECYHKSLTDLLMEMAEHVDELTKKVNVLEAAVEEWKRKDKEGCINEKN